MKRHIIWNDEMIETLVNLYPVETTPYVASVLGVCETTVKNKAKELGIEKYAKSEWLIRAEYIRNHFNTKSFTEIGNALGISKNTVSRIAGQIGLRRTDKETSSVKSRVRTELIKREKRRMIFGLDPITNIKVVTNRPRIKLRAWLKTKGYIVADKKNVMYYPADIERLHTQESRGVTMGLHFMPLPVEEQLVLQPAI